MTEFQVLQYALLYVFAPLLFWWLVGLFALSMLVSIYIVFLSAVRRMLISRFSAWPDKF